MPDAKSLNIKNIEQTQLEDLKETIYVLLGSKKNIYQDTLINTESTYITTQQKELYLLN